MAATTTYLTLVNSAIQEAGVDLASFAVNGSDFLTNSNAMMQRFRVWSSRAWKDIQQQCYDWDFMQEQGLCNLTPGIMFYTDGTPISYFATLANTIFNILDQDGTVAIPSVSAGSFVDLTGESTLTLPFGYFNFAGANLATPLNVALKPAAEYFTVPFAQSGTKTTTFSGSETVATAGTFLGYVNNFTGNLTTSPMIVNLISGPNTYLIGLKSFTTTSFSYDLFNTPATSIDSSVNANVGGSFVDVNTGQVYGSWTGTTTSGFSGSGGVVVTSRTYRNAAIGKAYVHSWKSFDFDEETQSGDFQENIQEIDPTSFRLVDYFAPAPSGEQLLEFVHWETFRNRFDLSAAYPGLSRLITQDDTGRYRLYPAPYYQISVKFDYARTPQILTAFGDIPRGINDDFVDLIMWKTLIYYGKYDEQPSVAARAREEYSNILSRLKQKNVDKVHFKPARLY